MVIDVVSFNGEADLFDIRYNILKDFVSEFIVVEARTTFSGNPKELYFPKIKDKYEKVKYHIIEDAYTDQEIQEAVESPLTRGQKVWVNEYLQKESIKKAMSHLPDDALCFVGDCDEIWNPELLTLPFVWDSVHKLRQLVYTYYLNNRSSEVWAGTYVAKWGVIKDYSLNYLRNKSPWVMIENSGWHFTNMGGVSEIKRKLESYGHQEFNVPIVKDRLEERMNKNEDFIGRPFKMWTEEERWPQYLINNREKYKHLLKNQ